MDDAGSISEGDSLATFKGAFREGDESSLFTESAAVADVVVDLLKDSWSLHQLQLLRDWQRCHRVLSASLQSKIAAGQ